MFIIKIKTVLLLAIFCFLLHIHPLNAADEKQKNICENGETSITAKTTDTQTIPDINVLPRDSKNKFGEERNLVNYLSLRELGIEKADFKKHVLLNYTPAKKKEIFEHMKKMLKHAIKEDDFDKVQEVLVSSKEISLDTGKLIDDIGGLHEAIQDIGGLYEEIPTKKSINIVALLLDYGANMEARFSDYDQYDPECDQELPLLEAVVCAREDVVKLLLERGANIEAKSNDFEHTALTLASSGHKGIVKLLLDHKANTEVKSKLGYTPLITAISTICNQEEVVKQVDLLLNNGTNMEARDAEDRTPLIVASSVNKLEVTRLLLNRGANIEAKDKRGYTSLHWAVLVRNKEVVKLLIENNADTKAKDNNGKTPLDIAHEKGFIEIATLLT